MDLYHEGAEYQRPFTVWYNGEQVNVISGLKVFDVIFALTNGGPGRSSEVVNITIFNQFSMGDYGYGTALNTVMFLVLSVISIAVIWFYTSREEEAAASSIDRFALHHIGMSNFRFLSPVSYTHLDVYKRQSHSRVIVFFKISF